MSSLAKVPLPNDNYPLYEIHGFLGFVYDHSNKKFYRFGTYTGAILTVEKDRFRNDDLRNSSTVSMEINDAQYIYSITAIGTREKALILWGPKKQPKFKMERYVTEMLDAQVQVIIKRRSDRKVVFEGLGTNGGLEIEVP